MKVTVERGTGLERTLTVEIPSDVVLKRINTAATDIAKKVNIPGGYRKLKPKVARVKQLYRNEIASQVASDLVEENLRTALDEQEIKVVGSPRVVDLGEVRGGKPFIYKVGVETHPHIENPTYQRRCLLRQFHPGHTEHHCRSDTTGVRHVVKGS